MPAQAASTFDLSTATGSCTATVPAECIWNAGTKILSVTNGADITITGTIADGTRVLVQQNATANITLSNVDIRGVTGAVGALTLNTGTKVTLDIQGDNTLAADSRLGIYMMGTAELTIASTGAGTGKLTAQGAARGAGIGGSGGNWKLVINSGNIYAIGGDGGAGIGGINNNPSGDITIHGGYVEATGGAGAAGIGSGKTSGGNANGSSVMDGVNSVGNIVIDGGTVKAYGGNGCTGSDPNYSAGGAGIGGGAASWVNSITITDPANVTAVGGNGCVQKDNTGKIVAIGGGGTAIGSGGSALMDDGTGVFVQVPTAAQLALVPNGVTAPNVIAIDPAAQTLLESNGSKPGNNPPLPTGANPSDATAPELVGTGGLINPNFLNALLPTPRSNPTGLEVIITHDGTANGTTPADPNEGKIVNHATPDGSLPNSTSTLTAADLAALFSDGSTVVFYNDDGFTNPSVPNSTSLSVGSNTVHIAVTNNGETRYYTLIILRALPHSANAAAVPTLNEWALMLLGLAMLGMAGLHARRHG